MSASDIVGENFKISKGAKIIIYAPLVREKKELMRIYLKNLRNKGYVRAQIDGVLVRLDEDIELSKTKKHTIKLVIDRLEIQEDLLSRLASDIEKGLEESFGEIEIEVLNPDEVGLNKHYHFSEHSACFACKISFVPLEPLSFSFNSPKGACEACDGLGIRYTLDMKKIIDESLSLENGAVKIMYGFNKSYYYKFLIAFCEQNEIPIKLPFAELSEEQKRLVLYGNAKTIDFFGKEIASNAPLKVW